MSRDAARNPLLGALRRAVTRALRSTSTAPGSTHPTRLPIDNNDVEPLMKQVALGRKNWLFIGTVAVVERSARRIRLVSSALRNDLDVERYLTDVFGQLLRGCTDDRSLLPPEWRESQPESVRTYRHEERTARRERTPVHAS